MRPVRPPVGRASGARCGPRCALPYVSPRGQKRTKRADVMVRADQTDKDDRPVISEYLVKVGLDHVNDWVPDELKLR